MRYKLLGRSGLRVSELCLGTMTFGEDWGWGASKEESRKMFDAFAGAGGNFVDTANRYTNGTSERYVGEFVAEERDYFVVATKYTLTMRSDDPNASGNQRKNIAQEVVDIAGEVGCSPAQVAINWVRRQPGGHIPLLGASRLGQLWDNLACLEFTLSDDHLARLDAVSRIDLGFPHEFLRDDNIRSIVYGQHADRIIP